MERDPRKPAALPLRDYCGVYEGDYGLRGRLSLESNSLVLHYGNHVADVEHWHDDTFRARLRASEQDWYLTFTVMEGVVTKLHIQSEHDIDADFVPVR